VESKLWKLLKGTDSWVSREVDKFYAIGVDNVGNGTVSERGDEE
jgi:hypothetical protein